MMSDRIPFWKERQAIECAILKMIGLFFVSYNMTSRYSCPKHQCYYSIQFKHKLKLIESFDRYTIMKGFIECYISLAEYCMDSFRSRHRPSARQL